MFLGFQSILQISQYFKTADPNTDKITKGVKETQKTQQLENETQHT
jgi:hypothetical protein